MSKFEFRNYPTKTGDVIDILYIPFASKLEALHRDLPDDIVLFTTENSSVKGAKRNLVTITMTKEEFINEFIPMLESFRDAIKNIKGIPSMIKLISPQGKQAEIEYHTNNTVDLKIKPHGLRTAAIDIIKKGITIEEANKLLKHYKFATTIARME